MTTTIIPLSQEECQNFGKRIQIRGFPKLWVDELTFDEIGWYLFDFLSKYGQIDTITVNQSKKDSIVYGVVDMQRGKDMRRIMEELLDGNHKLPLPAWNATLSFRQINPNTVAYKNSDENLYEKSNNPAEGSASQGRRNILKDKNAMNKAPQSVLFDKGQITPPLTETDAGSSTFQSHSQISSKSISGNVAGQIIYNRAQILSIRDLAADLTYKLDKQFDTIVRGMNNNENIHVSGNGSRNRNEENREPYPRTFGKNPHEGRTFERSSNRRMY